MTLNTRAVALNPTRCLVEVLFAAGAAIEHVRGHRSHWLCGARGQMLALIAAVLVL